MSKKSNQIVKLAQKVELPQELPDTDLEGTLLERGMYAVMLRQIPSARAKAAVLSLRKAYTDYNEARVSQAQELAEIIAPSGNGFTRLAKYIPAARELKSYLQAIYQNTHGLDLKDLEEDPAGVGRALAAADEIGTALVSYLIFLAEGGELPVLAGTIRVMDRLGVMTRTNSVRKAREALDSSIPAKHRLAVSFALGVIADRWCDSRKPMCWECPLLDDCPNGQKVHKDWLVQQERLTKQRAKEETRAAALAIKEEARLKREQERDAKAKVAALQKDKRRRDKANREAAKKKEADRKKKEIEKLNAAAARKRERDAEKQKTAAAKKKSASKKKAAKKGKQVVAKKSAKKATKPVAKKTAKKATKTAAKPTTKKKAATAKKTTKKAAKKATKKAAKKATKKKVAKKTPRRK